MVMTISMGCMGFGNSSREISPCRLDTFPFAVKHRSFMYSMVPDIELFLMDSFLQLQLYISLKKTQVTVFNCVYALCLIASIQP